MNGKEKNYSWQTGVEHGFPGEFAFMIKRGYAYLLVENVKNLLSVNAGFDFAAVLSEMDEAGYDVRWQVLNSKDLGVPQNRERVWHSVYLVRKKLCKKILNQIT